MTATKTLDIVTQVRIAIAKGNLLATILGAIVGGTVPLLTYVGAHVEFDLIGTLRGLRPGAVWSEAAFYAVIGGGLFSAITVGLWGNLAFNMWVKGFGFTILLELAMVAFRSNWRFLALAMLIAINAIATGVNMAIRAHDTAKAAREERESAAAVALALARTPASPTPAPVVAARPRRTRASRPKLVVAAAADDQTKQGGRRRAALVPVPPAPADQAAPAQISFAM